MILIGDKPLHLPAYTGVLPAIVPLMCPCGWRFIVFTGEVVRPGGEEAVQ